MNLVEPIRDKKDIQKIKDYLKKHNERDYVLFLLGINSGLRISDLLKLKVKDIKNKQYIELQEKKTGKQRKVLITSFLQNILYNYIKTKKIEDWLFCSRWEKKSITRVQAYRILKNGCKNLGIDIAIGTHTLRKTFGYHHYKQFKDIALLQKILNHSSPEITLRYIGINQDIIDSSLQKFCL